MLSMELQERVVEGARELARRDAVTGGAGKDWTVAETILAAYLCVFGDPSRMGGTKIGRDGTRRQHPAVTALASALGRNDGSVVTKVMNLRSRFTAGARGLSHGSHLDGWTARTFGSCYDDLTLSAEVIATVFPPARPMLDALSPRWREGWDATADMLEGVRSPEPNTQVMRLRAERRGQELFRSRVMANYQHTCAFCGLRSRLPDSNSYLLIASHIRPWSESTGHQRLDNRNGLALCAIHDRAFDWGFATVDDDLRIVVSPVAREHYAPEERIEQELSSLNGRDLIRPNSHFVPPSQEYLEYHRTQLFEHRFLG